MKNYGDVVSMMNGFLQTVEIEKKAATKVAADDSAKKEEEGKKSETPAQGAPGKEKSKDTAEVVGGVGATTDEAKNKDGDGKTPVDNQGTKKYDAGQAVDTAAADIKVENTPEKVARATRLGNAILSQIAALSKVAEAEKTENIVENLKKEEKKEDKKEEKKEDKKEEKKASAIEARSALAEVLARGNKAPAVEKKAEAETFLSKLASEQPELHGAIMDSFHQFAVGWIRGFEKRAEDRQELLNSGLVKTAAEADMILDKIAAEDAGAVLPEEAGAAPAPEAAAPGGADVDQIVEQLDAAGVKPEDIDEAAKIMEQLQAQGVSPEEIVQAVTAMDELQGAGAAPEEIGQASDEVLAEDAGQKALPTAEEKKANVRKETIKDYIRSLRS